MAMIEELYQAVSKGKRKDVQAIVNEQLEKGTKAVEMLMESMVPAMRDLGERFSRNEVYVPEMLIAARAMQAGLDILEPHIAAAGHQPLGKVCIGTVKGDLHDIGKNLVAMMLKGAGFEVNDCGVDCDIEKFDKAVQEGSQAVLLSALLTTTMPYMKDIVSHFAGRDDVKVVIGGAPITQQFADEIGAHGYAENAGEAVKVVEKVLNIAK